jgi:hypothetical protein
MGGVESNASTANIDTTTARSVPGSRRSTRSTTATIARDPIPMSSVQPLVSSRLARIWSILCSVLPVVAGRPRRSGS